VLLSLVAAEMYSFIKYCRHATNYNCLLLARKNIITHLKNGSSSKCRNKVFEYIFLLFVMQVVYNLLRQNALYGTQPNFPSYRLRSLYIPKIFENRRPGSSGNNACAVTEVCKPQSSINKLSVNHRDLLSA
jgi:hypothetical protein